MNDRSFVDTNILVYSYTADEPKKKAKAVAVLSANQPIFVSTQVLAELSNVLRKKFLFSWNQVANVISEVNANFKLHTNTYTTLRFACALADKYQLPFYDALIAAAAIECGCAVLYSEDFNNGLVIEKVLTIKNPII